MKNLKDSIDSYAKLAIQTGLNVQPGQEVVIYSSINQNVLVQSLVKYAYEAKAKKVRVEWHSDDVDRLQYLYQAEEVMGHVEQWEIEKLKHRVEALPCRLYIEDSDPDIFKDTDQSKMANVRKMRYPIIKPYIDAVEDKEQWCIIAASSYEWAAKVYPNVKSASAQYNLLWSAILTASRANGDGIENWKNHNLELKSRYDKLNEMKLKELHYKSANGTDFTVGLMPEGRFCGGAEKTVVENSVIFNPNIPSEEVFTTPKKGIADGLVVATKPLSYNGELIENFSIRFENGKAVEVKAEKGEALLNEMINMDEGSAYLGECALVPYNSPINKTASTYCNDKGLFYTTLFDENACCHLALGRGFNNCVQNFENYDKEYFTKVGVNDSMIHVDFMIGSEDLEITGITENNEAVTIFKDGVWYEC